MEKEKFLSKQEFETLVSKTTNHKHRLQILIMCEAGLRVSEMINLKWSDCDFKRKMLKVRSLKKREKEAFRSIPISERLYEAFALVIDKVNVQELKGFIFVGSDGQPIKRTAVNMMLKRLQANNPEIEAVNPHKLRHTFATNLRANGAELEDIKDVLGHEKLDTSLIYAHADKDKLRELINKSSGPGTKDGIIKTVLGFVGLRPTKPNTIINITAYDKSVIIGRDKEIKEIETAINKGLNVVITGATGIGKSHLIDNLKCTKKVIEIDSVKDFKRSILNCILWLFDDDKESAAQMITGTRDRNKWATKMSVESLNNLIRIICELTPKGEYILKIGDIDDITPTVVKALIQLGEHFQIVTTARAVKMEHTAFMWNFERLELKELDRLNTLKLFQKMTDHLTFENLDYTKNAIWNTSEGNPKKIIELSERLGKEPILSGDVVEDIVNNYIGKRTNEIDMSLILFLVLFGISLLRFMGRATEQTDLRFIGSAVMIILMFFRYFFKGARNRKSL